jgi:hypothetical protein
MDSMPGGSFGLLRVAFGVFVITFFITALTWKSWCFLCSWRKGEVSLSTLSQALASNPSSKRLQPVLRAMGLAQYKVEVSEIHLGSLFAGSCDVRVNFRMGNGNERRTKVLKNAEGTFLRFDDALELTLCSKDPPCSICITDRRGDLAHVELPSAELIRLATRPHQEYFRTELAASRELGGDSERRPYVAMRIRSIVAPPMSQSSLKSDTGSAEKRAYGSFAV